MVHRVSMLNMLLGPAVGAMGGEYSPADVGSGQSKTSRPRRKRRSTRPGEKRSEFFMGDQASAEDKERGLLNSLAIAGLPVRTVGGE